MVKTINLILISIIFFNFANCALIYKWDTLNCLSSIDNGGNIGTFTSFTYFGACTGADVPVGTERDVQLIVSGNTGTTTTVVSAGTWTLNSGPLQVSESTLQWDGNDASMNFRTNGVGPVDFTQGGASGIYFEWQADANFFIELTFQSGATNLFIRRDFTVTSQVITFQVVEYLFTDFSNYSASRWASITGMQMRMGGLNVVVDVDIRQLATFGFPLSGRVWYDCDGDCLIDTPAEDFECVTLTLSQTVGGALVSTSTSDCVTGDYTFAILDSSISYTVCLQSSTNQVCPSPGGCYTVNPSFDPLTGYDFGLRIPAAVTIPPAATVACVDTPSSVSYFSPTTGTASVTDVCSPTTATYVDASYPDCGSFIRTWRRVDDFSQIGTQTIFVTDLIDPVITLPNQATTISCASFVSNTVSFPTTGVTADDQCDDFVVPFFNDGPLGGNACSRSFVRTWTAIDDCGNESVRTQIFSITDSSPPTFSGTPAPTTVDCIQFATANAQEPVASDNCDPNVSNTVQYTTTAFGSGCTTTWFRQWIANDGCASTTVSQVITVTDTDNPVLVSSPPASTSVDCRFFTTQTAVSITPPVYSDLCGTVTVTESNSVVFTGTCTNTFSRTWTSVDQCAHSGPTVSTTVSIFDNSPPNFGAYSNPYNVYCGLVNSDPTFQSVPGPSASDPCGHPTTITETDAVGGGYPTSLTCDGNDSFVRTYTADDGCGNTSFVTQNIVVFDNVGPTVTSQSITVPCETIDPVSFLVPGSATDACDPSPDFVGFFFSSSTTNPNFGQTGECIDRDRYSVVWQDSCANSGSTIVNVDYVDTEPPFLFVPPDSIEECGYSTSEVTTGIATALDNCADNIPTFVTTSSGTNCFRTYTRTWSVSDNCGNSVSEAQLLLRQDTQAPQFQTFPADRIVECDDFNSSGSSPHSQYGMPTVTDCQVSVTISSTLQEFGSCNSPDWYADRTITASDGCGNVNSRVQVLTIQDTELPIFPTFPPDVIWESCTTRPSSSAPTCSDSCSGSGCSVVFFDEEPFGDNCYQTYRRFWDATDDCGNTNTRTQLWTRRDTRPPVFNTADPQVAVSTWPCDSVFPDYSGDVNALATDQNSDCNDAIVNYSDQFFNLNTCQASIQRTWSFSDLCDNSGTYVQRVSLQDIQAPIFVNPLPPTPVTISCTEARLPSNPSLGTATATDNCTPTNAIRMTYRDTTVDDELCPSGIQIIREWTATDACGSSSTFDQTINVILTTPPTVNAPRDVVLECGEGISIPPDPFYSGVATASSPCLSPDLLTIGYEDFYVLDGSCPIVITRTWSVVDACGFGDTDNQIISIDDFTRPYFVYVPPDLTFDCQHADITPPASGFPIALDNCDFPVCEITYYDVVTDIPGDPVTCPGERRIERTWSATDNCGNTAITTQLLTVLYSEPLSTCPEEFCPIRRCELCECPITECDCCEAGGVKACNPVPCSAVACSPVSCTAVDCIPCDFTDSGADGDGESPIPFCSDDFCIPVIKPIFVDDDDGQISIGTPDFTFYDLEFQEYLYYKLDYWQERAQYWQKLNQQNSSGSLSPFVTLICSICLILLLSF